MSFLVTLLFPVLIIIVVFNSYFINAYKNNIIQQNKMNLEMYQVKIDSHIQNCAAVAIQLPNADGFSYQQLSRFKTAYSKIAKMLKAYQIAQDFYSDVSFYSLYKDDTIYTTNGTINPMYYYQYGLDQMTLDKLLEGRTTPFWTRTLDNKLGKENNPIIQYIIPVAGKSTDFVLFDINEKIFNDISAEDYIINEIYNAAELIYSTNQAADKEKMQVISTVSAISGLEYKRYVPTDILMENVQNIQLVFMCVMAAIIILGGLLVYFVSVARYLPIKRLTMLAKDVLPDVKKSIGELEYIGFAINYIGIKNEEYLLKDRLKKLFYSIIYSQYDSIESITTRCKQASLFFEGKKWRALILSIENESLIDNHCIDNICRKVLETDYEIYFLDYSSKKHFIIILGSEQNNVQLLENKLSSVVAELKETLGFNSKIFVGGCYESVTGLSKSYNEAIIKSGDGLSMGDITFYDLGEKPEKRISVYPKIELESLGISIIESDIERISFFTNILTDLVLSQSFGTFTRISISHDIIKTFFKSLEEINISNSTLEEIKSIDESVQLSYTIDDYVSIIRNLQKVTLTTVSVVENPQPMRENDKIKEFVDSCDDISQLCVGYVAEHFGISISNLSHRFKSQTGMNISNYIVTKRIECAKLLLTQTDMNLSEIAEKLSYCHTNSFMRVFKSIIGITPGEYRRQFTHKK